LANLDPIIRHQQPIDPARKIAISSLGQDPSFAVPVRHMPNDIDHPVFSRMGQPQFWSKIPRGRI